MNRIRLLVLMASLLGAFTAQALESGADAEATSTVVIPGAPGKFDFLRVDARRHRLLAAHEKDNTLDVIDLDRRALVGRVSLGGAVDTAVDELSKFYYVSVQDGNRVAVVDAESLRELRSIKLDGPSDAIVFNPHNQRLYVTHDDGEDVWVVDPVMGKVVATIAIPGTPEFMVYDASADRIYVNIKTKNVVAVIDPATNQVTTRWATGAARGPHGLALDERTHRAFVAGANGKLVAIDTRTGASTGAATIAPGVDQIAYDSVANVVYCAGPSKMSVVDVSGPKLLPLATILTSPSARNVAVDGAARLVWTTYTDGKNSYARSWHSPPK